MQRKLRGYAELEEGNARHFLCLEMDGVVTLHEEERIYVNLFCFFGLSVGDGL